MRLLSVIGARPQFIKAAAISHALKQRDTVDHRIVHTGQHYDDAMNGVFFRELDIPSPDHNLGVGSGSHAFQTAEMMRGLEPLLETMRPDWVLLYGDTNSTAAGALTAAKAGLRIAHVEAGLRSYNRSMPEEINRVVADHVSDLLLCPTVAAMENLRKEGLVERAVLTGDVMYDAALRFRGMAERTAGQVADEWSRREDFALATLHRACNTDDAERLRALMRILDRVAREVCPVVMPLHPRTQKLLQGIGCEPRSVRILGPVSYLEMLVLEKGARFILTDSGGVQKEAYFAQKPCITLREETEWTETLTNRCNVLVGADEALAMAAIASVHIAGPWLQPYGGGDAAERILSAIRC